MALTTCTECRLPVSDKAIACPHCGFPIQPEVKQTVRKRTNRRKRLPNGFGRITEIKGQNLREPFRVMVTTAKDSNGRPIGRLLKPKAFFKTYNEAYAALVAYNRNPYDLDDDITVAQLFDRWTDEYYPTLKNPASIRGIKSAWAYCGELYNYRAKDVRARHIKGVMENGVTVDSKGVVKKASPDTQSRIKSLFNLMFDYGVEYELLEKNYARTFNVSDDVLEEIEQTKNAHIPFKPEEMLKLWSNVDNLAYVDIIIIQAYSGWRPQELGLIELVNVDLENWTFTGGMKTEAGANRTVPIHSKIRDLVKKKYEEAERLGSKYIFNCIDSKNKDIRLTYDKYSYRFERVMKILQLNPDHRPHDPRMDFITRAKKAGTDEYAIKIMAGHKIDDVTEKVYTLRDIEWLRRDLELVQ